MAGARGTRSERGAGLKRTWIEKQEQLRPTWRLGDHAGQPKMRAKIISEVASWSEERRTHQAEKFDRPK